MAWGSAPSDFEHISLECFFLSDTLLFVSKNMEIFLCESHKQKTYDKMVYVSNSQSKESKKAQNRKKTHTHKTLKRFSCTREKKIEKEASIGTQANQSEKNKNTRATSLHMGERECERSEKGRTWQESENFVVLHSSFPWIGRDRDGLSATSMCTNVQEYCGSMCLMHD